MNPHCYVDQNMLKPTADMLTSFFSLPSPCRSSWHSVEATSFTVLCCLSFLFTSTSPCCNNMAKQSYRNHKEQNTALMFFPCYFFILKEFILHDLENRNEALLTPHHGRCQFGVGGIRIYDHPHASVRALPLCNRCQIYNVSMILYVTFEFVM